jgi:hypothetical protein
LSVGDQQGLAEENALRKEKAEKSREFTEKGSELYAKAVIFRCFCPRHKRWKI